MRKSFFFALSLAALTMQRALAQPAPPTHPSAPPSGPDDFNSRVQRIISQATPQGDTPALTTFNLDFPGGTPKQLAAAIEKAMNKPLNVIVPEEFADTKLPPIKVTGVTTPQLFQTLLEGSYKYGPRPGQPGSSEVQGSFGFKTIEQRQSDNSIWTFFVHKNQAPQSDLTTFSIDFPGGKPKELIGAIQKATGRPLNAIVPEEFADTKLPPLKMSGVDVSQLFRALELASMKTENYVTGTTFGDFPGGSRQSYQQKITSYGFKTDGRISDESIWYFHVEKTPMPPGSPPEKTCRFYALAPYLDHGLKVDDITTAVQTGWKMAGETTPPTISFHKDTQLLIAVGPPDKLQIIDAVLQALKPETTKPQSTPPPEKKPGESKTEG